MSFTASGYHHGITVQPLTIGRVLARPHVYHMTDNQRPPAWTVKEMVDVFADVDALPSTGESDEQQKPETHFLGPIELQPNGKSTTGSGPAVVLVVDGQQRIVSLSVLSACLREKYEELGATDAARELDQKYLKTGTRDGAQPTVRLTELYDDEFQELIDDPTSKVSNDRLGELSQFIRDELDERVNSVADVDQLVERFLHRQVVVDMTFDERHSQYRLFEGCNGRGIQLGPVDHIKNRLMEKAEAPSIDKSTVERHWKKARRNLDEVNESRALRYWVMAFPYIPVKDKITNSKLHPAVKEIMDERLDEAAFTLEDYAGEFAKGTRYYRDAALANVSYYSDTAANAKINRHLENLNKIGATPPRILVVRALYAGVPADEMIAVLEMAEKLSFVRRVVERRVPQEVRAYISLAHSAFKPGTDTVAEVRNELEGLMPSKPEFERAFARKEWNKGKKTQYLLSTLEYEYFRPGSSSGFGDRCDGEVEHVAPRGSFDTKKYSAWGDALDVSEEEFNLDVDRIGNLTLLESRLNIKASNNPFDQKKPHYDDSSFTMANEIADNYDGWSMDVVDERSNRLAEIAADIWAL